MLSVNIFPSKFSMKCIRQYFYKCAIQYVSCMYSWIKEFDVGRTGSLDYQAFEKLYHSIVNVKAVSTITQSDVRKKF